MSTICEHQSAEIWEELKNTVTVKNGVLQLTTFKKNGAHLVNPRSLKIVKLVKFLLSNGVVTYLYCKKARDVHQDLQDYAFCVEC